MDSVAPFGGHRHGGINPLGYNIYFNQPSQHRRNECNNHIKSNSDSARTVNSVCFGNDDNISSPRRIYFGFEFHRPAFTILELWPLRHAHTLCRH